MPKARPFSEFLLEQGSTHDDLTDALAELVDKVMLHGKPGTLTLKLTVKKATKGDADLAFVSVADEIVVKAPAGERAERIFFAHPDGGLTRHDPRQLTLPEPTPTEEQNQ